MRSRQGTRREEGENGKKLIDRTDPFSEDFHTVGKKADFFHTMESGGGRTAMWNHSTGWGGAIPEP
jgi:hypothetical protein